MPTGWVPGQQLADVQHWHRCMELADMGWPLRAIAQQLRKEYPGVFPQIPSHESVRTWIARGREEWDKVHGPSALDPSEIRPRMARRIHRLMGELDMARHAGALALADQIPLHVLLERLEAKLVGTDAPKVSHHTFGGLVPAVHEPTAAAIEAVEPARLPRRRAGA